MMAQREQRLVPERVIGGKYKIIRLLGEGGMGGVYEAENELTHKRVAIKWLHPSLAANRDAVQRLLREAQACARVRHPHVVDVYDVGQESDSIFLVMEYLEGETLRSLLARRELPLDVMLGLLIPAMRGVAAVHEKGIVHRDIKPDNIFLARVPDYATPVAKVLDFGISKVDARQGEMDTLTQSGVTMGTPLYMSFEQLSGAKDADARSDIYAFGVILYEAATGRPPYEADSFAALAVKVATTRPTAPRAIVKDIDPQLEAVILKAMARDRTQRFATLDELVDELEPFATFPEVRSSKPTRGRASGGTSLPASAFAHTMPNPALGLAPDAQRNKRRRLAGLSLFVVAAVAAYAYLRSAGPAPAAATPQPLEATVTLPAPIAPAARAEEPTAPVANPEPELPPETDTQPLPLPEPALSPAPKTTPAPDRAVGKKKSKASVAKSTASPKTAPVASPKVAPVASPKTTPAASPRKATDALPETAQPPAPQPRVTPEPPVSEPKLSPVDKGFRAGQPRLDEF